jgi:hypothetical protein
MLAAEASGQLPFRSTVPLPNMTSTDISYQSRLGQAPELGAELGGQRIPSSMTTEPSCPSLSSCASVPRTVCQLGDRWPQDQSITRWGGTSPAHRQPLCETHRDTGIHSLSTLAQHQIAPRRLNFPFLVQLPWHFLTFKTQPTRPTVLEVAPAASGS